MHCLPGRSQNGYRFKMTYKSLTAVKKYLMRSKLYRLYFTILVLFLNPPHRAEISVSVYRCPCFFLFYRPVCTGQTKLRGGG